VQFTFYLPPKYRVIIYQSSQCNIPEHINRYQNGFETQEYRNTRNYEDYVLLVHYAAWCLRATQCSVSQLSETSKPTRVINYVIMEFPLSLLRHITVVYLVYISSGASCSHNYTCDVEPLPSKLLLQIPTVRSEFIFQNISILQNQKLATK
jgi:hypothetical protein